MKLVVAGSRSIDDFHLVLETMNEALFVWGLEWESVSLIIHGGARGVDRTAETIARTLDIPFREILPDYQTHGRYIAPKIRNGRMADEGDRLVAVRKAMSGGTTNMIEHMISRKKPYIVREVP